MNSTKTRTRGERMRDLGGPQFTGRTNETAIFEKAIDAIKKKSKLELEVVKTAFDIHGEGGMGKTSLLWEFERICRKKGIVPVYFDIRLYAEPNVSTIVDFLRILRKHLGQLSLPKFLGANPFADFDQSYARYIGLEELRRRDNAKNDLGPSTAERLAKLGTKMALGVGQTFVPFVFQAAALVGKENLDEVTDIASRSLVSSVKDIRARLLRIFGNNDDVQFYMNHQDELTNSLVRVVFEIAARYCLVILIDSYEEIISLDPQLREKVFALFPENVVLVFSGRNSIYDNCSPAWREDMHFFEMSEFSNEECALYLKKRKLVNKELARAIWNFTQGIPLAVALVAEIYQEQSGNVKETLKAIKGVGHKNREKRAEIIEHITERFLTLVPEFERRVIDACAILGQTSIGTLEGILEIELTEESIKKIENYSFMNGHDNNLVMHRTVRNFLLSNLNEKKPKYLNSLHNKAANYFDKQLANLDLREKFQNEEWTYSSLERIYHLIQADPHEGRNELYKYLSEGLWERNFDYCLSLIEVVNQPLQITKIPSLEKLRKGCNACVSKDYQEAIRFFTDLLSLQENSPYFNQMVHDTLGDLYLYLDDYSEAVNHFQQALAYFRKLEDWERLAITHTNIAECYRYMERQNELALENYQLALTQFEKLDKKAMIADVLFGIGNTYSAWKKYAEAVTYFEKSRSIYEELGQEENIARVWQQIGIAYREWEKYEPALENYERALTQFEKLDKKAKMAEILFGIGNTYRAWGKYSEAVAYFEKSRSIYEELGQEGNIARLWQQIGIAYHEWEKYESALENYQIALTQFEKFGKATGKAECLWGIGLLHRAWEKYSEAVTYFEKSRSIYEELGQEENTAGLWNQLGIAYREWGKYEPALENYQIALTQFEKLDKKAVMADIQFSIGNTYRAWEKYAEAVTYFEKSRSIYEELGREEDIARVWQQIGIANYEWKKYEPALENYQIALRQFEKLDKKAKMADVLVCIANNCRAWKKYAEAVTYFEKSRSIYEELEQEENIARVWQQIGIAYREWEKYEPALENYERALTQFEKLDKKAMIADVLFGIGNTYWAWGKYSEAIDKLEKGYTICSQLKLDMRAINFLVQQGVVYGDWGKNKKCLENYDYAVQQLEVFGSKAEIANIHSLSGVTYRRWGYYEKSSSELEKSRSMFEALGFTTRVADSYHDLGITYREWGKYEQSKECYTNAFSLFKELAMAINLADILLGMGRNEYRVGNLEQSIEFFEESMNMYDQLDLYIDKSFVIAHMAPALVKTGKYAAAIELLEGGIKVLQNNDYHRGQADCFSKLIIVYKESRHLPEARTSFDKATALYSQLGRHLDLAEVYTEMGVTEANEQNANQALQLFQNAAAIYRELGCKAKLASVLKELGSLQRHLGLDGANRTLSECMELFDKTDQSNEAQEIRTILSLPSEY